MSHPSHSYCGHCSVDCPCECHAIKRDENRIRAELRDRLDRCDDHDGWLAFGWLSDNHPDLVCEALDETGAPS